MDPSEPSVISLSDKAAQIDRAQGLLLGLGAGDKNGGPIRMAVRLCEACLVDAGMSYSRPAILQKYINWVRGPPHDNEQCFDTGASFYDVFRTLLNRNIVKGEQADAVVEEISKELYFKTNGIGINGAHRNAVLAALKFIPDDKLDECVANETRSTHWHPLSVEAARVTNQVCRRLICGEKWDVILNRTESSEEEINSAIQRVLNDRARLDSGGYAPNVLETAFHFVHTTTTFEDALASSIMYAGPENYCPVLVGSIAGVRYGRRAIEATDNQYGWHSHIDRDTRGRMENCAQALWKS